MLVESTRVSRGQDLSDQIRELISSGGYTRDEQAVAFTLLAEAGDLAPRQIRRIIMKGQQDNIQVGGYDLDASGGQLKTPERKTIATTPTETSVLALIMINHPEFVTRKTILDSTGISSEGNSLTVAVSNLRRKIGPGVIATKKGHGYAFRPETS